MNKVTVEQYQEPLGLLLEKAVKREGYPLANYGITLPSPVSITILKHDNRDNPRRTVFGRRKADPRMIALIWIDCKREGATAKRWTVEAWGNENLQEVTRLVNKLATEFGARAKIKVRSEKPRYSTLNYETS